MKKTNKKGFTIVELVIVIAVIAILAGVLIPTFSSVVEKANLSRATQAGKNAYTVALAEEIYDGDYDANTYYVTNGTITWKTGDTGSAPTSYDFKIDFTAGSGDITSANFEGKGTNYAGYTYSVTSGVYTCAKS